MARHRHLDPGPIAARMLVALGVLVLWCGAASANPALWKISWPKTDFSKHSVAFSEITSGGPPKDGIPSIDQPKFVDLAAAGDLAGTEPVISIRINGDARAYPLRVLIWHEIVNDTVGGVPVTVTYCPLCNSAIVFDRRLDGRVLDFGTIAEGRDLGNVVVERRKGGAWVDEVHDLTFAFVFHAFVPDGKIHKN